MKTLFGRLFFRFVMISLIIIVILGLSMIYFFKGFYFAGREDEIIKNSQAVLPYLRRSLAADNLQGVQNWLEIIAKQSRGQAWLLDRDGYLVMSYPVVVSKGSLVKFKNYQEIFTGKMVSRRVESSYFERPMLLVGLPVLVNSDTSYGLLIFTSVAGINSTINQVQKMMLYSSLIAVLLGLIIAYNWSRSLSNPLKRMSKLALELSQGKFGKTIEISENDEIGTLAGSINHMSQTLQTTVSDLTEERNKLNHILSGMEEGVLAVNTKRRVILANGSALSLLAVQAREITGQKIGEVIKRSEVLNPLEQALVEEEIVSNEITLRANATEKRILIHCTPIYDNNNLWGVVALLQDISERWRFEQLQQDFVANVTHELKTPLSSIKGAGEILLDRVVSDPDRQSEYLEMIVEEVDRLEAMVNDVLDLAVIDANSLNYETELFNINRLIAKGSQLLKETISTGNHSLTTVLPDKKIFVRANTERIKQVLLNLVDNACKFSPGGGQIEIGVEEEKEKVKIWVKDQGIGMPAAELENIWERFYKVDKSHTPAKKGSGLGLAISKKIVEHSGGRVFVESVPGKGSTFGFYLPKPGAENPENGAKFK